ncbi:hypothetical protein [Curtobacterium sp. DN_7.5]|uniref:hypothetical protein n=1 Tax=Curtobacterium sp. DN_7.5 TaxID=3049047 RepID=UPI001F586200|nr:hypothetical protein [Curtobacterium sp. DN_7.5]
MGTDHRVRDRPRRGRPGPLVPEPHREGAGDDEEQVLGERCRVGWSDERYGGDGEPAAERVGLAGEDPPDLLGGVGVLGGGAEITPERSAAGTSVLFVVLVLGQAVGAAGLGGLVDGLGPATTFALAAVVTAACAALAVRRRRSEDRPELDLPVAGS